MNIKRTCVYCGPNVNVLPAILYSPKVDGFVLAFKWGTWHAGVYVQTKQLQGEYISMVVRPTVDRGCHILELRRDEVAQWNQVRCGKILWTVYGVKRDGLFDLEYALTDCRDEETAQLAAQALRNFHGIED